MKKKMFFCSGDVHERYRSGVRANARDLTLQLRL